MSNLTESQARTLALAGVIQTAYMVKTLAWKGFVEHELFATAVNSIFCTDPENAVDVYGNISNVYTGLEYLQKLLSNKQQQRDPEIARYSLSLLHLEQALDKNKDMMTTIQRGITRIKIQATHFTPTHENVVSSLANLYSETLSTLKFRIHIVGDNNYLHRADNIGKIRVCLLAGVRAGVLWRQLGGSRWQFLFGKKAMLRDALELLNIRS